MSEPRVLVVMEAKWPRALLVAALGEAGYHPVGLAGLDEALTHPTLRAGSGPVRVIVLDHTIPRDAPKLQQLLTQHSGASPLYLDSALLPPSDAPPSQRLQYPVSIGEVVRQVKELLPIHNHP
jgi:hypothetical protein